VDRKGGRFTERRTGPSTVAEVCGKNTYRLSDQKKVNSTNLTRYVEQSSSPIKKHKTYEGPQSAPAPKRTKLLEKTSSKPVVDNSLEITQSMSTDSITVTPVCEDWQKFHSKQLNFDFERSTKF